MAENRIQDWIRYVQENSENLNDAVAQKPDEPHAAPKSTSSRNELDKSEPSEIVPSTARETVERKPETSPTSSTRPSSTRNARERTQRVRLRPETRAQMLARLTNPMISLYEASVILGVCSATVRRYCDLGTLPHLRTEGGQRRFRLREVLTLARTLEAKKRNRR